MPPSLMPSKEGLGEYAKGQIQEQVGNQVTIGFIDHGKDLNPLAHFKHRNGML